MKSIIDYINEKQCENDSKEIKKAADVLSEIISDSVNEAHDDKQGIELYGRDDDANIMVEIECGSTNGDIKSIMRKFKYNVHNECWCGKIPSLGKDLPQEASNIRIGLMKCSKTSGNSKKTRMFTEMDFPGILFCPDAKRNANSDFFVFIPKKFVTEFRAKSMQNMLSFEINKTFNNVLRNLKQQ